MAATSYKAGDTVMVKTAAPGKGGWHVGIVTHATDSLYETTGAEAKYSPSCSVRSSWDADCIKPATPEDLASLPDWARDWLELQLLDHNDPRVPTPARPLRMALHGAGIHRLSDLRAATDVQLLGLKGIGRKALLQLREWQQARDTAPAEVA